jgi:hypothetical protein
MQSKRTGTKQDSTRGRTVREDWFAWLPDEMDQLFGATRNELECSNAILSVALDEALTLREQEQLTLAKERAIAFAELFDRLAIRLRLVIRTLEEHGSHFGTLPNVAPLAPANFCGVTARRISFMDSLRARINLRGRTKFFHKLQALKEIIQELQSETRGLVEGMSKDFSNDDIFVATSRDVSRSRREPSCLGSIREVSESSSGSSLSRFFRETSASPRMKFGIAWGSFGILVVPLAALVAGGMSERAALFTLLAAILPVLYAIFVASNKIGAAFYHTAVPDEEKPHKESFPEESLESNPIMDMTVWKKLEVLGYDLNTCMGETTIVLKSFLCALPADELEIFVRELRGHSVIESPSSLISVAERRGHLSGRVRRIRYLTPEDIAAIR